MEITENSIPKDMNPNPPTAAGSSSGSSTSQMTWSVPTFGGLSIGGMLFIIFLVLKLTGAKPFKNWSYWRVTAPLWLPVAVVLFFATILFFMGRIIKD